MIYKIKNIVMWGNEQTELTPNTIYADLFDECGNLYISATLKFILTIIRDRELIVEGINWTKTINNGVCYSNVTLELYK